MRAPHLAPPGEHHCHAAWPFGTVLWDNILLGLAPAVLSAALRLQVAERAWHSGPCGDEALRALLAQLHALLALLLGPLQRLLDQARQLHWLLGLSWARSAGVKRICHTHRKYIFMPCNRTRPGPLLGHPCL